MKRIIILLTVLTVVFMAGCSNEKEVENNNSTGTINNEQVVTNNEELPKEENKFLLDEETANEYIKLISNYANNYPNSDLRFELVYFDSNDIPDLVIDLGSILNLFEYENGQMKTIIEMYSYGIHGRWPSYYEKKGVMTDFATDSTEGWGTEFYELVNGNLEMTYSRSGKIEGESDVVENGHLTTEIDESSSIRFLDDYNNCTLSNIIKTIDASVKNTNSQISITKVDDIIDSRYYEANDHKFSFPFLNLDGNDAAKVNLELRIKEIELIEKAKTDNDISEVNYKYSYANNGSILSFVVGWSKLHSL